MNIIKKLKWFLEYYDGDNTFVLGGRVTKVELLWEMSDDEATKFLSTFYNECPPIPWVGDRCSEQHYLLKSEWEVVRHINTYVHLIRHHHLYSPKYLWSTLVSIWHIPSDHKWYMNPTRERHGY